jgi:uncharacterized protein YoxC
MANGPMSYDSYLQIQSTISSLVDRVRWITEDVQVLKRQNYELTQRVKELEAKLQDK